MSQALTTHLLQSTFFALAAGLWTVAFRRNRAQVRYWLWLSASVKFFVPFVLLTGLGGMLQPWVPTAHRLAAPAVAYTVEQFAGTVSFPDMAPAARATSGSVDWIPAALFSAWLCGFVAIVAIRLRSWLRVRAIVRAGTAIDIPAAMEVRLSAGMLEPGVVGMLRPVLLLPEGIVERLTPSELGTILAHEICHVRRRDNLFAAIHMIVEAVFWFHPLVWWIGARLVEERERACDEEVLRLGNRPDVYADAILSVCKLYVESPLACVSGVSGAGIGLRIEAIMANRKLQALNLTKKFLLATAGIVAFAGPVAIGLGHVPAIHAQPPIAPAARPARPVQMAQAPVSPSPSAPPTAAPRPKFDVVSVRRCMPGDELSGPPGGRGGGGAGRGPRYSPGRLRMQCLDMGDMILTAYIDLGMGALLNSSAMPGWPRWLRNAPAWALSDWYTIDAETDDPVANGPTGPGERDARTVLNRMLQSALEDRFQLKLHRDTEDVPMYNLTVARDGLKLKPMAPGGCVVRDPAKGGGMTSDPLPPGQKPLCVNWTHTNGSNWAIDSAGQTLDRFAGALSMALNRHVLDKTGVTDLFTFNVQFAHDESAPGNFSPEIMDRLFPASDVPSGPSVFTVLEGLGLKLEPTKGPQGIIVVDHIERPSEN